MPRPEEYFYKNVFNTGLLPAPEAFRGYVDIPSGG